MDLKKKLIRLFSLEIHRRKIVSLPKIAENSIIFFIWASDKYGYDNCPFPIDLQKHVEKRLYNNEQKINYVNRKEFV